MIQTLSGNFNAVKKYGQEWYVQSIIAHFCHQVTAKACEACRVCKKIVEMDMILFVDHSIDLSFHITSGLSDLGGFKRLTSKNPPLGNLKFRFQRRYNSSSN